jgi:hypothetical protein
VLSLSLCCYSFNSDDHAQNGKQSKLLISRTSFLPCIIVLTTSDSVETCDGIGNLHAAACLDNRTDVQCLHRWQKVLNPNLVKGYWTAEVLLHAFSSLLLPRPDFCLFILKCVFCWTEESCTETRKRETETETETE